MRKYLQEFVSEMAYYLEILLSVLIGIALFAFTLMLIRDITSIFGSHQGIDDLLESLLRRSMAIAIGVELLRMLSNPSPAKVIEVLLFAVARQLVVEHPTLLEILMGIVAVGILFAIRKYLFSQFDDSNNIVMRASQKVKMANVIARVHIEGRKSETLREFVTRKLEEEEKTIAIGACVYLKNVALRIDNMHGDVITRVEIIRSIY